MIERVVSTLTKKKEEMMKEIDITCCYYTGYFHIQLFSISSKSPSNQVFGLIVRLRPNN